MLQDSAYFSALKCFHVQCKIPQKFPAFYKNTFKLVFLQDNLRKLNLNVV